LTGVEKRCSSTVIPSLVHCVQRPRASPPGRLLPISLVIGRPKPSALRIVFRADSVGSYADEFSEPGEMGLPIERRVVAFIGDDEFRQEVDRLPDRVVDIFFAKLAVIDHG